MTPIQIRNLAAYHEHTGRERYVAAKGMGHCPVADDLFRTGGLHEHWAAQLRALADSIERGAGHPREKKEGV